MDGTISTITAIPPIGFLSLPRELRDQIYEYVLVDEESIDPSTRCYGLSELPIISPQLLQTNKLVCHEAAEILYSRNRFDFNAYGAEDSLNSFLDQIGLENSNRIWRVRINLPKFRSLDVTGVELEESSVRILEKLKTCCGSLRTLAISRVSVEVMEQKFNTLEHPKAVAEAFGLVDAWFRAIPSLEEKSPINPHNGSAKLSIVIEVFKEKVDDDIRRVMCSKGWVIEVAEEMEDDFGGWDDDRNFGDVDFYSDEYNSGGEYNEYDIDNDSDFWRRAGD